jgi:hypothetical protein
MIVFDVETLGKDSSAVILSMAAVWFDPLKKTSPQEMREQAFFVKLNAEDQITRLKRTITKSSLSWWNKQCDNVKIISLRPRTDDVKVEKGIELMREWSKKVDPAGKSIVWARGNLDQLVLDAMEEKLEVEPVFFFNRWRDVRTAVDLMYNTTTGYCKVDYPDFSPSLNITKHDPVDDCILDAMMLMYGVENEIMD